MQARPFDAVLFFQDVAQAGAGGGGDIQQLGHGGAERCQPLFVGEAEHHLQDDFEHGVAQFRQQGELFVFRQVAEHVFGHGFHNAGVAGQGVAVAERRHQQSAQAVVRWAVHQKHGGVAVEELEHGVAAAADQGAGRAGDHVAHGLRVEHQQGSAEAGHAGVHQAALFAHLVEQLLFQLAAQQQAAEGHGAGYGAGARQGAVGGQGGVAGHSWTPWVGLRGLGGVTGAVFQLRRRRY